MIESGGMMGNVTVPGAVSDLSALQLVSHAEIRHSGAPPLKVERRAGPGNGVARYSRVSHVAAHGRID